MDNVCECRRLVIFGMATTILCCIASPSHGQLRLSSTIRDFRSRHPNMDVPLTFDVFQFEQGIVKPTLDEDGKPIFNNDGLPFDTVTNEEDFFDWYHDVPGTNLTTDFELVFRRSGGQWRFGSTSTTFRPIDGRLFGDEDPVRGNNHFTLETHAEFTYEGGESFRVASDDDAWLFIDNKLVLDGGGIHDQRVGTLVVQLDELGLTVGQNYSFDFFYAERAIEGVLFLATDLRLRQGPPELLGDFDLDGRYTAADIDMLSLRVRRGVGSVEFDVTEDGVINSLDREFWVNTLASTFFGDSDFDGQVQFADFLPLSAHFGMPGGWSEGDFDGSGDVGFPDFLLLANSFGQSVEPVTVPEPAHNLLHGLFAMFSLGGVIRRIASRSPSVDRRPRFEQTR